MAWVIDSDGGIDDCQALVLATQTPDFNIIAINTVWGNSTEEKAYRNIKQTLYICECTEIPIYRGAKQPVIGPSINAEGIHGSDILNGYYSRPDITEAPPRTDPDTCAALAICELVKQHPKLNFVMIGPLTNLAIALLIDPDLDIGRVICMGGTSTASGNRTPLAEFNILADTEAAHIVFSRLRHIELVPWETTLQHPLSEYPGFVEAWENPNTERGRFIQQISHHNTPFIMVICDSLAVAYAIDSSVATETELDFGQVETGGLYSRGLLVLERNIYGLRPLKSPNCLIIQSLDFSKITKMLINSTQ